MRIFLDAYLSAFHEGVRKVAQDFDTGPSYRDARLSRRLYMLGGGAVGGIGGAINGYVNADVPPIEDLDPIIDEAIAEGKITEEDREAVKENAREMLGQMRRSQAVSGGANGMFLGAIGGGLGHMAGILPSIKTGELALPGYSGGVHKAAENLAKKRDNPALGFGVMSNPVEAGPLETPGFAALPGGVKKRKLDLKPGGMGRSIELPKGRPDNKIKTPTGSVGARG